MNVPLTAYDEEALLRLHNPQLSAKQIRTILWLRGLIRAVKDGDIWLAENGFEFQLPVNMCRVIDHHTRWVIPPIADSTTPELFYFNPGEAH